MGRKFPLRFTRFGWLYVFFSLAVGAAAINTGNNLLYLMLGLLLGFIIISGFLSDSCLWGADAQLDVLGDLYTGQPGEWDLTVQKSWFPGVLLEASIVWPDSDSRSLFYWIPRYGRSHQRVTAIPARRGVFAPQRIRFSTRFPFGLFEKSHGFHTQQSWVVFPRVEVLSMTLLRSLGMRLADQPTAQRGPGSIPWDLREYQMGDSSKRIHWKSSAKRGQLMVTETELESGSSRTIKVTRWPIGDYLESFIEFVASLVFTLHRQGQPVGLQTPGVSLPPDSSRAQLKRILGYLALLNPQTEKSLGTINPAEGMDALALWQRFRSTP